MFEWVYRLFFNKTKNETFQSTDIEEQLANLKKKWAVKRIENFYLNYKRKEAIRELRRKRRKEYRILNRTNPMLLKQKKKSHKHKKKGNKKKSNKRK